MTSALRVGVGKSSRWCLFPALERTAAVKLSGEVLERFAHGCAWGSPSP